jgi:hypothetical protein
MAEYINKQDVLDYLNGYLHSLGEGGADDSLFDRGQRRALINSIQDILAVKAADVQLVISGDNCIVCGRNVHKDDVYYDVNGGTICEACMNTKCKCKN